MKVEGLVIISRNIRDILKRCRGLFKINYIWWEGLFAKKGKQGGSFWKKGYKGWGSLVNRGKVGGLWAKCPSPSSPHAEQRRGRGRSAPASIRRPEGWWRPGMGTRERGDRGGSTPPLTSSRGGVWRRRDCGGRRAALAPAAAAFGSREGLCGGGGVVWFGSGARPLL